MRSWREAVVYVAVAQVLFTWNEAQGGKVITNNPSIFFGGGGGFFLPPFQCGDALAGLILLPQSNLRAGYGLNLKGSRHHRRLIRSCTSGINTNRCRPRRRA